MNPPKSILSRAFRYRDSAHTDVAATFRRIRAEKAKAQIAAELERREPIQLLRKSK